MNILNNLWLAVSTPNDGLLNLFNIPLALFIEMPLSFNLISTVFNISYSKKQRYIYIIISTIIALLSTYVLNWPFNVISNYLTAFVILLFILKTNIVKAFIASFFPSIIFNLVGSLLFNPYLTIFNLSYDEATTIPIHRIIFSLIMYLLVYLFILIFKHNKFKINILENLDTKNKSIIILNIIFGIFNIIIQGLLTVNYIDILPMGFTFFNFICLTIYFGLSLYSMTKVMNLVTTTQKLESAEEYNG